MTDQEKSLARLENTEKALFALVSIIQDLQPAYVQEGLSRMMGDYFDANTSLGFEPKAEFTTKDS